MNTKNIETKNSGETAGHSVWIDKQDVLMRMHISVRTLQRWRTKGKLPYTRVGGKIYYQEADLERMLRKGYRGE